MAKLADYYICELLYTKEGYVIADEDDVRPNIYEDNDKYIKEFWGEYKFIGKFPVMYRGKQVDAQFDTREKAEEYSLQHEGLYWVYEMSKEW